MRQSQLIAVAPRLAAVVLVLLAALQLRADVVASLFTEAPRIALAVARVAASAVVLVCFAILTLRLHRRWVTAALIGMTVGWLAQAVALEPLRYTLLDAALAQGIATVSGVALGVALARTIGEPRIRHSAMVLLFGYAVLGGLTALTEHRIALSLDYPTIVVLRQDRDFTAAISDIALAGVLWLRRS